MERREGEASALPYSVSPVAPTLTSITVQISVYFILPETKGVSLERMDKIFGEVDAVAAGEQEASDAKIGTVRYSQAEHVGTQESYDMAVRSPDQKV